MTFETENGEPPLVPVWELHSLTFPFFSMHASLYPAIALNRHEELVERHRIESKAPPFWTGRLLWLSPEYFQPHLSPGMFSSIPFRGEKDFPSTPETLFMT